ncbi:hypothetical protein ACFWUQ_04900 [Streptomyces sp. NPDC058662]|uniref:hypothetical protein n=1 Tax=Streptomyces sp. NPDC058662 TaxID=3346583 RepID=UPI00364F19C1
MMDDHTPRGGASDEEALRGMLRGAVEGIRPADGALERLRYAVPVRRTRRRQALVGAAAVALLAGTAVPAAVHMNLMGSEGAATHRPAMAGHDRPGARPGADPSDPHQNGHGLPPRSTRSGTPDAGGTAGQPQPAASSSAPAGGTTAGPSSTGTTAGPSGAVAAPGPLPPLSVPGVPGCGADQLGVVGSARVPEADGKVYGSFTVTNVSARGCALSGPDTVTAAAVTAAVPGPGSAVPVVGHTAGDPASGLLPDPSAAAPVLVLPPRTAYEVRFAWVPSGQPCPAETTAGGTGSKPADGVSGTPSGPDGDAGRAAEPPVSGTPAEPAGVAVSHTPGAGAPTTRTTILAACGGTVYRTGTIPLDAAAP